MGDGLMLPVIGELNLQGASGHFLKINEFRAH